MAAARGAPGACLRVQGTCIVAEDGSPVILKGVSLQEPPYLPALRMCPISVLTRQPALVRNRRPHQYGKLHYGVSRTRARDACGHARGPRTGQVQLLL